MWPRKVWHRLPASQILFEVSQWAAGKRDHPGRTPMVFGREEAYAWREGYKWAMNEVAQHFNMERYYTEQEEVDDEGRI